MRSLPVGLGRKSGWLLGALCLLSPSQLAHSEQPVEAHAHPAPITVHVLDTAQGKPAIGLSVVLSVSERDGWKELARAKTDETGRITELIPAKTRLTSGVYQIRFATRDYFHSRGIKTFYPEVPVIFEVTDPNAHYHLPLILSPYGYSTYRGS